MSLLNLTAKQLRTAADLIEEIAALEKQLAGITGTTSVPSTAPKATQSAKPVKKGMSAAGRAKVAAAQKARWAKIKAAKAKK